LASQVISHYRLIEKLGAGGMGEVYLAEDIRLQRKVAIKVLPVASMGDKLARKRLIREARAAGTLDHPNICPVYEVGDEGIKTFIVMQFVEGQTLHDRIETDPPTLDESIAIAAQVADALVEAHSHGIVHRDIKPQNIMLTDRGRVKVLDFGVAKIIEPVGDAIGKTLSQLTAVGTAVGTVPYMSPEQVKGEAVDGRSDLFSLGTVLYECVTGRRPFSGSSAIEICAEIIHKEQRPAIELNPGVRPELNRILTRALRKSPAERYQSASEMLADLCDLTEAPTTASAAPTLLLPVKKTAAISRFRFLQRGMMAALGILALSMAAIVGVWVAQRFWRTAPHQPSKEAQRFYEMGADAIRNRSYYQASKVLERAVALDGKYALAHARLAEAYSELDQTEKAKDELLTVSSMVPDRGTLSQPDAMYLDAIAATIRREFAQAINLYRKIADQASDAEKPRVVLDLGRAYDKNDNTDDAIDTYLEVTRLDSQSAAAFLQLGILYGRKQDLQSAEQEFDKALAIYQDMSNQEGVTEMLFQRSSLLSKIGKLANAREQLESALEKARTNNNKYQEIKTLLELSRVSYSQGNGQTAVDLATQATEAAQKSNTRSLATDGLINLGNAYNFRGQHQEAERYFKQALDFARNDMAHRSEARALLSLGGLSVIQDDPDQATSYLEDALAFYQPAGYRRETSLTLSLLGRAKRQKGDYEAALRTFEQELQSASDMGDPSQVAFSHANIGILLGFDLERYAEALGHLDDSLKTDTSLGARSLVGNDLMNRGRLLWQLGRYDQAKKALDEAFSIASDPQSGSKQLLAWTHLGKAQMALSQARYTEARVEDQEALVSGGSQSKEIAIQAKYTLGLIQTRSGNPLTGNRSCEEAITLAAGMNPRLLSYALLSLAEVRLSLRDAPGALKNSLEAGERFAQWGQQEAEWRAWLVAARANKAVGDDSAANDHATRANAALSRLHQKWNAESYEGYSSRPDIRACRQELDGMMPGLGKAPAQ